MTILRRYLTRSLFAGWAMVFAIATAVFGLLFLLGEMEHLGEHYHFADAAWYVLLSLPQRMLELLPVLVLLGTILVLVNLEMGNELTIIGIGGVGSGQLLRLMALPMVLLMSLVWFSEEYVTSNLNRFADEYRTETFGSVDAYLEQAAWSKDNQRYVHIGKVDSQGRPVNIEVFLFNGDGSLSQAIFAKQGQVLKGREWRLQDVTIKDATDGMLTTRKQPAIEVENLWLKEELPLLKLSSESMPLSLLYGYSQFLKENGQPFENFQLTFWKRITLPIICAAMMILATPIGGRLGSSRNSSIGLQLGFGILVGIFFYLGSQIIYALGAIKDWHPAVTCLLPAVVILLAAIFLLRRQKM